VSKFSPVVGRCSTLVSLDTKDICSRPTQIDRHLKALGTRLTMYPHFEERAILYRRWTRLHGCFPSVITDVCGASASGPPRCYRTFLRPRRCRASQPTPVQNLDTAN
jgi:hypothetical protein